MPKLLSWTKHGGSSKATALNLPAPGSGHRGQSCQGLAYHPQPGENGRVEATFISTVSNTCFSHQPNCLPEAVESCSLFGIAEDLVRFRNELEPLLERTCPISSTLLKDLHCPRHRRDWRHPACLDAILMLAFCRLSWPVTCLLQLLQMPAPAAVTCSHCSLDLLCICISRNFQQLIEVLSTRNSSKQEGPLSRIIKVFVN